MRYLQILPWLLAGLCPAQSFEVASIKPNAASDHRIAIQFAPGGRFVATGIPLRALIGQAYNLRDFQITGGPDWIASERYDINAKADASLGDRIPPDQLRPMLKNLLAERFGFKAREETREMPVYHLVIGKAGAKLKENTAAPASGPRGQMRMTHGSLSATGMDVAGFARMLAQQLGRTVIDKTGLTGRYDFELSWAPDPGRMGMPGGAPPPPEALAGAGGDGPTLFTAVQEQLGLRLENGKGPVPILVIEAVAKPSEN